ncbi:unnamed protein product, partial [marine sediment metagenome]
MALTQQVSVVKDSEGLVTPDSFALALTQETSSLSVDCTVTPDALSLALTQPTPTAAAGIINWKGLNDIRNNLGGDFVLDADLDENTADYDTYAGVAANGGLGWDPIGPTFTGTINFAGHTISDLFIDRPDTDNVGLFRRSSGA